MAIDLIDQLAPKNAGDFGICDDGYVIGGYRVVADVTARDAIPAQRRKEGMRVRAISEDKVYELVGGVTNSDWEESPVIIPVATGLSWPYSPNALNTAFGTGAGKIGLAIDATLTFRYLVFHDGTDWYQITSAELVSAD